MKRLVLIVLALSLGGVPVSAQQQFYGTVGKPQTSARPLDKTPIRTSLCSKDRWLKCENHKQYQCWQYFNTEKSSCRTRCQPSGTC